MEEIDDNTAEPHTGDRDVVDHLNTMAAHHDRIAETITNRNNDSRPAAELDRNAERDITARLVALRCGNVAQRQFAALITRALDLAEATSHTDDERDESRQDDEGHAAGNDRAESGESCSTNNDDEPGTRDDGYRVAMTGIDALESLTSAVEAARSRMIARSYAYAHEELDDPDLSPGQAIQHRDGSIDRIETRAQITATDLSVVLRTTSGRALMLTEHAVQLCAHMPNTLARLDVGELTTYQASLITREAHPLTPEQAAALDEAVCGRPFTGAYAGLSQHRAPMNPFRRRLTAAVKNLGGRDTAKDRAHTNAHKDRYVRFGLSSNGMTSLHGLLPDVDAAAITTLLDDYAHTAADDPNDQRTHEQLRADVFRTLFLGPAALSPPAQLAFDLETASTEGASYDEDGAYTIVDREENLQARGIYDTIRLLAACLNWTLPNPAKALVHIDITAEVLAHLQATVHAAREHDQQQRSDPPTETNPQHGSAAPPCPEPGSMGQLCPETGSARQPCPDSDTEADSWGPFGPCRRYRPATVRGIGAISLTTY